MNPKITKEIFKQARLGWILEKLGRNFRRYFNAKDPKKHKVIAGIVDPTWQVGQLTDDCERWLVPDWWRINVVSQRCGRSAAGAKQAGGGMRFTNITIPNSATILSAYLRITCKNVFPGTPCNTRISAEKHDDAPTFADDKVAFDARYANHTDAVVDWNNIPVWAVDVEYPSSDIKTVIQEIVNRPGWASGQAMVLFWEDYDDRSVGDQSIRDGYSWDGSNAKAPKLEITFSLISAPTVTTQDATDPCEGVGTLHGTITDNGGENCDERGFEWGLVSGGPYPNSWTETDSYGVGAFSHTFTDFPAGSLIYYRAKAHNSAGWGYGGEKSFTTCAAPPPPPGIRQPKIELRLSDTEPPAADPPRTIYRDVLNLPDPVLLGITIRYYNYDDVGLYFKISAAATGYTFTPVELGLLASGANAYRNLDEFGSRAKPGAGAFTAGEFEESIVLILRAYTDAGYTNLKWTYQRTVTIVWIKSDDPAFTVDELDNFDDGTLQGWAAVNDGTVGVPVVTADVVADFVLSPPNSLRARLTLAGAGTHWCQTRTFKSFTTPNKNKVYAIFDMRILPDGWAKRVRVLSDAILLIYLGRPYNLVETDYIPSDKWIRIVTPLTPNAAIEVRISTATASTLPADTSIRLDDFKIISK